MHNDADVDVDDGVDDDDDDGEECVMAYTHFRITSTARHSIAEHIMARKVMKRQRWMMIR